MQNKNTSIDYLGKIPPQSREIEESILGAFLIDKNSEQFIGLVEPDYFYSESNGKIFSCISDLNKNKKPFDVLMVCEELRNRKQLDEIGGGLYLTKITGRVASSANIEFHIFILEQKYLLRELIAKNNEQINNCFNDELDLEEILDQQKNIYDNAVNIHAKHVKIDTLFHSVEQLRDRIELRKTRYKENKIEGVPSFIKSLDDITCGFQGGDFIIIAGRPSMGKTAVALKFTNEQISHNIPVCFFSLEMMKVGLLDRIVVSDTELNPIFYKKGNINNIEQQKIDKALDEIIEKPLYIDDTPAVTTQRIGTIIRSLVKEDRCKIAYIDYLQLIKRDESNKNHNTNNQVGKICKELKAIAKENDIPIIALAQLNREVESRGGSKRPKLSDLRDSGEIEQDADLVIFPFREDVYDDEAPPIMEFIIAKHRQGELGNPTVRYKDKSLTVFIQDEINEEKPVFNNQLPYASDF